jgi:FtsH-binding integral membrane protein
MFSGGYGGYGAATKRDVSKDPVFWTAISITLIAFVILIVIILVKEFMPKKEDSIKNSIIKLFR